MKLAVVVQRYGADINGGAELHARYVAEHLARHAEVEVLTTCARDYVTWRNELPPGEDRVNGVRVLRFPVRRPRDPDRFGRRSERVFNQTHSAADERGWLDEEGPASPRLVAHLARNPGAWEFVVLFSYRYYHAYYGAAAAPDRALLVPTAERDPAAGVSLFGPLFRGVRALMYNSPEERALIEGVAGNATLPGVVVGVGSEIPEHADAARFRQKHGVSRRFILYVGRIDENKGCKELFEFHRRYARSVRDPLQLVLCGNSLLPIPESPHVRHLGFVSDADKFDALAAADLLVMPSYFESLSMVALEAWAMGRPVLANARCDVLKGQCIRSNAGLYYKTYDEFAESLAWMARRPQLAVSLGENGRRYFERHYAWPVIEGKYLDMFDRLRREAAPSSREWPPRRPGWLEGRRPVLPPAASVVERVPAGPVLPARAAEPERL